MTAKDSKPVEQHGNGECVECPIGTSRRAFLRQTGLAIAAAVAAASLGAPGAAFAERIVNASPIGRAGRRQVYPIPAMDGISIDEDNDVILARWERRVYAFSQRCPHKGAPLEWRASEQRVFCPKHKARFLGNGSHDSGRGSRDLDRYAVSRNAQTVVVDLDALHRADRDATAWEKAFIIL